MQQGIATKTNVYKVYDNETSEALDGVVTVELPNFELAVEAFKGAGLAGEVNVPSPGSMSALTAVVSCPIMYGPLTKYLALGKTKALHIRNEIIVNDPTTHELKRVRNYWVLKGPLSAMNPGSFEQAAAGEAQFTMQVYYAHHWLDGTDVLEWDPFKFIFKVNGEDLLEETRQNILA